MFMNFDIPADLLSHIETILDRFFSILPDGPYDRRSRQMDLIACHNGGCPLDFAAMAKSEDFAQVMHDVTGIGRYLNCETGELEGHFHPRFALPEPLKPGHKVSYTTVRKNGSHGLSFSSREGTLVEIRGVHAQVKAKNGRLLWVNTSDLRRVGQQNALTEAFWRPPSKPEANCPTAMNSTALILHPTASHARPITRIHPQDNTLETRGPILGNHTVHTRPGHFLAVASFENFVENRERYCVIHPQRRPKEMEAWELEAHAARRIVALVDDVFARNGEVTWDHLREIRWRAIIAQPYCTEDWIEDHLSF